MSEPATKKNKVGPTRLLNSGIWVSSMTMLSRVLGLIRDIVLAIVLGGATSGGVASAFYIAFKVPQFLRRLFAEGAFSQAFVPVLSEYQTKYDAAEVKGLIDRVAGGLTFILVIVVGLIILGSSWVTALVAPGFIDDPEVFSLTESLVQITFPYLLFISLTGFLGSILNANNHFIAPAFTPVLLNACLIAAGLYLTPWCQNPAYALAYGVLFAGIVQLFFLIPFVIRLGLFPKPKIDFSHPGVKKILALMLPALFGVSVAQINLVFDTILATFLPEGSIPWLYYSQRLSDLPLGVFAIAISTVILPGLSRSFVNNDKKEFIPTLDWAVKLVLLISIPSVLAFWVLAKPLLITLFLHGSLMTLDDINMMSLSFVAYATGIPFFMLIKVLVPGYYARQEMKIPVKIAIKAMVVNMILNVLFVIPLHYYFQWGHAGLALATTCSAILNVFWLWRGLVKEGVYAVQKGFYKHVLSCLFSGLIMLAALMVMTSIYSDWSNYQVFDRILVLAGYIVVGLVVYFSSLWICGVRPSSFYQKI
jgi:putative peptidoglycan lipid II flippase